MYSTIKIECIGAVPDGIYIALDRILGGILGYEECFKKRWWVAEITGKCEKYGLSRKFLSPRRDASCGNSVGSRGIYANYMLEHGKVYEISSPVSWKKTDRYFCKGESPRTRIGREDVLKCLRNI